MQINIDRLLIDIEKYSKYGKNESGGVTRPSFSQTDHAVRALFIEELEDMGLKVYTDGAANIWGRRTGTGKKQGSIVIGSHLDSVPNGGKYDGPLGVLMAKEIVKTLIENNVTLDHDIEIVSFTAEESNDFNLSTFGSRAFVGRLNPEMLKEVVDSQGTQLSEELEKVGGGLDKFPMIEEMRKDKKAFIELHIEQGKRLESKNIPIAIIDRVVGTYRTKVKVIGQPNHSGTTMMDHRRDALTAAAEMILEVERQCKGDRSDVVGTVGKLDVLPNAANIIPGQIEFIFEVRGETEEQISSVVNSIQEVWKDITNKRKVKFQQEVFLDQKPVVLDKDLVDVFQKTAAEMDEPYMTLSSMAVHDAAHMTKVTKSCMVFVKSIDGKSHCPEEYSPPNDIEKAGNLILQGIVKMDQKLKTRVLQAIELPFT
ncbi:Zn-dependent hydrolase [Pseudalkalibacillus decolorationis]|uniref:Zn-dependent hydrolase n=1 Tax=Pseudalkalibacillus decolorationis TaxID=163879 RepID=UPI0021495C16|nr:Zn-dependent hydrolase [Pseudalkalibacillus decolorationis]